MEAYLYQAYKGSSVRCELCSHLCVIQNGKRGICGVRQNEDGILKTLVYGRLVARNIDPIEKKPLFHLMPGSRSYSIATVGCNFQCRFCQNADIAQMPADRNGLIRGGNITPADVVADALQQDCHSIAYTYTEPTVYFEFAYDTARIAHAKGLKNVFVTNGYMSRAALEKVAPYLDGANVDLKAFSDEFYKKQCGARLEPVKQTLLLMKQLNICVEITTLLIPGLNDDPQELKALADFIAGGLGPEIPWHISRFHPTYHLTDRPPTPVQTLERAYRIGCDAGLRYVYLGNVPGEKGESTFCHSCGELLVERLGFFVRRNRIIDNACSHCRTPVYGLGMSPIPQGPP
jgi:pyruvate formate lyase activating enzyme